MKKSELRKMKKAHLLDMYREEFPWKGNFHYSKLTKEQIIKKTNRI